MLQKDTLDIIECCTKVKEQQTPTLAFVSSLRDIVGYAQHRSPSIVVGSVSWLELINKSIGVQVSLQL